MVIKIEKEYHYPFESTFSDSSGLRLVADDSDTVSTPYFIGAINQPYLVAPLLLANAKIALSRFYTPPGMIARLIREADPVITIAKHGLRFESFSQCCGVYASTFIAPEHLDVEDQHSGTTNVDFNASMRAALAKVRARSSMQLEIGQTGIQVKTDTDNVFERKVKLPLRWIKGFMESQSYLSNFNQSITINGVMLRQFLQTVSNLVKTKDLCYLKKTRTGIRQTQKSDKTTIAIAGIGRLQILKSLARQATGLTIYGNSNNMASAFKLDFEASRFTLLLSPSVSRGFSGEGQLLTDLATADSTLPIARIRSEINWNDKLTIRTLSSKDNLCEAQSQQVLNILSKEGKIGFDLKNKYWFKRHLSFVTDDFTSLQPRLKSAYKLIKKEKLKVLNSSDHTFLAHIGDVPHVVDKLKDEFRCSCEWYSKYQLQRGPCKHILAVNLIQQGD